MKSTRLASFQLANVRRINVGFAGLPVDRPRRLNGLLFVVINEAKHRYPQARTNAVYNGNRVATDQFYNILLHGFMLFSFVLPRVAMPSPVGYWPIVLSLFCPPICHTPPAICRNRLICHRTGF